MYRYEEVVLAFLDKLRLLSLINIPLDYFFLLVTVTRSIRIIRILFIDSALFWPLFPIDLIFVSMEEFTVPGNKVPTSSFL
jgi:hypothetical protein